MFCVVRFNVDNHFHHFDFPCWFLLRWKIRWSMDCTAWMFSGSMFNVCDFAGLSARRKVRSGPDLGTSARRLGFPTWAR